MEITPDLTPDRLAALVDGGPMPTECLVCVGDDGRRITEYCTNPACDDGLVWPDDEEG